MKKIMFVMSVVVLTACSKKEPRLFTQSELDAAKMAGAVAVSKTMDNARNEYLTLKYREVIQRIDSLEKQIDKKLDNFPCK